MRNIGMGGEPCRVGNRYQIWVCIVPSTVVLGLEREEQLKPSVEEVLFRFRSVGYWKSLEPLVFATVSLIRINRRCSIVKVVKFPI